MSEQMFPAAMRHWPNVSIWAADKPTKVIKRKAANLTNVQEISSFLYLGHWRKFQTKDRGLVNSTGLLFFFLCFQFPSETSETRLFFVLFGLDTVFSS
jgi:hypothetical protein